MLGIYYLPNNKSCSDISDFGAFEEGDYCQKVAEYAHYHDDDGQDGGCGEQGPGKPRRKTGKWD